MKREMRERLYSGSVMGLNRAELFVPESNLLVTCFLDEEVDRERMRKALDRALKDCPYMTLSIVEDEGLFLAAEENDRPLPLLEKIPCPLNSPENGGHAVAICCEGNRLTMAATHALTDGRGFGWFFESLLEYYYGAQEGRYHGVGEKDYGADAIAEKLPGAPSSIVGDEDCLYFTERKPADQKDTFLLRVPIEAFRRLRREWNGSSQMTMTLLALTAVHEVWPDRAKEYSARVPINARPLLGIPNAYKNASMAGIRLRLSGEMLRKRDAEAAVREIRRQFDEQYREEYIFSRLNENRRIFELHTMEEMLEWADSVNTRDSILVSSLGRMQLSENCARHIRAFMCSGMVLPLMIYSVEIGDGLMLMGYDGTVEGGYRDALKAVLARNGLSPEELDPETGEIR